MARRPDPKGDALNRAELEQLQRNLSLLSPSSVVDFYRRAHRDCEVERRPSPKSIQSLVTAWKLLRQWKWR